MRQAREFPLAISIVIASATFAGAQDRPITPMPKPPVVLEARFVDGTTMRLLLRDEHLTVDSRFGQLIVRVPEIRRIDFALRVPLAMRKQIDAALAQLSSKDPKVRESAMFELYDLRENAYPFLVQTAMRKDTDAAVPALQIIEKLRETMSQEQLEIPLLDIIYTDDARLPGLIKGETLHVATIPFGEQELKLDKLRSLRTANADPEPPGTVLPDPGTLSGFQYSVGQSAVFRVTAPSAASIGERGIYGTGVYAIDSSLARAAIHAGILQPGQTGLVRVTFVGPQQFYQASSRNGVVSSAYGPWPGFRVEAVPRAPTVPIGPNPSVPLIR